MQDAGRSDRGRTGQIADAVRDLVSYTTDCVLVCAAPGVGTSTTLVGIAAGARSEGWRVVTAAGSPAHRSMPYATIIDLLRDVVGAAPAAARLTEGVPEVHRLLGAPKSATPPLARAAGPGTHPPRGRRPAAAAARSRHEPSRPGGRRPAGCRRQGHWIVLDSTGTPAPSSPVAQLSTNPFTGTTTLNAGSTAGTIYLTYLIDDGVYTYGDQSGPATTNGDLSGTAVVPVTVNYRPFAGTIAVTGLLTVMSVIPASRSASHCMPWRATSPGCRSIAR